MYEVKFKKENDYTGVYGPVFFVEGVAKVKDQWIAAWFEGKDFEVKKLENDNNDLEFDSLTVEQLKSIADQKGISYDSKIKKDDLIKLLEGAE